mmetsp:Transcript_6058/g.13415  ORF Transcript_6058/g.13415 Transcript_6058/m.13415 type:complete len:268 (-) Transcript_6058:259-1062(-)
MGSKRMAGRMALRRRSARVPKSRPGVHRGRAPARHGRHVLPQRPRPLRGGGRGAEAPVGRGRAGGGLLVPRRRLRALPLPLRPHRRIPQGAAGGQGRVDGGQPVPRHIRHAEAGRMARQLWGPREQERGQHGCGALRGPAARAVGGRPAARAGPRRTADGGGHPARRHPAARRPLHRAPADRLQHGPARGLRELPGARAGGPEDAGGVLRVRPGLGPRGQEGGDAGGLRLLPRLRRDGDALHPVQGEPVLRPGPLPAGVQEPRRVHR